MQMGNDVQKAIQHIQKNYGVIRNIRSVAESLGFDYERLRKAFAREQGKSMQRCLEETRINAARWRITEGKKLYAVAREIGYASETTLIKNFKKVTGMTPKQYYRLFKSDEEP
jgi:two-component system response regulator YesN